MAQSCSVQMMACTLSRRCWVVQRLARPWQHLLGSYKRQDDYKQLEVAHQFISLANGREAVAEYFAATAPKTVMDLSSIQGGSNFMASQWFVGYAPKYEDISFTIMFAGMPFLLVNGKIRLLLVEFTS